MDEVSKSYLEIRVVKGLSGRLSYILLTTLLMVGFSSSCTKDDPNTQPIKVKKKSSESEHRRDNSDGEDLAEQRAREALEDTAAETTNGGAENEVEEAEAEAGDESASVGDGSITYKAFDSSIDQAKIDAWVAADQAKRGDQATNYRYAVIPPAFMADVTSANYARIALSKAINSVAVAAEDIVSPEEVSEGHGVVFALNLPAYWGQRALQKWNIVASGRGKRVFSPAPTLDLKSFNANQPIAADRLVYNLLHGGIYNQLLDVEGNGNQQKRKIGAGEVTVKMGVKNAITIGPRYSQRRQLTKWEGSYWESFDQFNGRRGMELPYLTQNRLPRFRGDGMLSDWGTVASEAWNHMQNGMIAYYIWGNANQERTKAEQSFVVDPLNNKGGDLVNGFCIFCHVSGVQSAPNDIWTAVNEGRITGQHSENLKSIFTKPEDLSLQYAKDREIFEKAMRKVVYGISGGDDKFNDAVVTGADPKEPCYFLVSKLTNNRLDGVVRGNNTKEALRQRGRRY